jgi:serine/threonine protein phosphatase PrpC
MRDPEPETAELLRQVPFAEAFFASGAPSIVVEFGGATHRGNVRPNNEDQFAVFRRKRSTEVVLSSIDGLTLPEDVAYGFVVTDGVGGARSGEVASRLAIEMMLELSGQATSWVMKLANPNAQQIQERAEAYVQRIQESMLQFSRSQASLAGMGTTWTSAHLLPPHAVVVHLGDSRAYLFREGQLHQVTRDETMAQAYINAGADPRSVGKYRRVLLNSLGNDRDKVVAQIHCIDFGPGDRLLLCTDGLYEMVSSQEILRALQQEGTPQEICDALVRQALIAGGADNVTVVLAVAHPPAVG